MINNLLAARVGDIVMEPHALIPLPVANPILQGEVTVLIGQGPPIVVPAVPTLRLIPARRVRRYLQTRRSRMTGITRW